MRRFLTALLVGSLVAPSLISAQAVNPGARVRLSHPGSPRRTATLLALTADTVIVRWTDGADSVRIPVDQVSRLDVSLGRHRHVLSHMGGGFAIGAAGGALLGLAAGASDDCQGEIVCPGPGGGAIIGGIFFGVTGALVGAVTGLRTTEQWERVSIPPGRVRLALPTGTRPGGIGLAVAF